MTRYRRTVSFFSFIIVLMILSFLGPAFVWRLREPLSDSVTVICAEGEEKALWPFANRKFETVDLMASPLDLMDGDNGDYENRLLFISRYPSRTIDDSTASMAADLVKDYASRSGTSFFDGASLSEEVHPLYRERLESFLNIRNSGWSLLYLRNPRRTEDLPAGIARCLASLPEADDGPILILSHLDGRVQALKSGVDFSGKAPFARLDGWKSEIYGWIPVYVALEGTEACGSVDLELTPSGRRMLDLLELPDSIPLAFRMTSPLGTRWFFAPDLMNDNTDPGSARRSFKEWFFSRIALFRPGRREKVFWKIYLPLLSRALSERDFSTGKNDYPDYIFRAEPDGFTLDRGSGIETFYIEGVNLGTALPGKWFTQFPESEELYYRWFSSMKVMGLNSVRIYTLLPPSFYRALRIFNETRGDDPLFLIQEIWPEEHPPGNNLLDRPYRDYFQKEIAMTIDALHGKGYIESRAARAWGRYSSDVSRWTAAILIGRELEPDEVLNTNRLNPGFSYSGRYISSASGSPAEAWLASALDYAARYERDNYLTNRPLGVVSWPTLDPLDHPVEWNDPELEGRAPYNDKAEIDINKIDKSDDFDSGLFGAYHIYPNYPDFMNTQISYKSYKDEKGIFPYGAYLKEFMDRHRRYPAIVAEYGLSTSLSTAHYNPEGLNHGGLTEEEQAEGIIRMADTIRREGYAGAVIFEWIDEWAKKTWTTEPFMIPYDRQALWHNLMDPEQNYGLIAMEGAGLRGSGQYIDEISGLQVSIHGSESALFINLDQIPGQYLRNSSLLIGFDTVDRRAGIFRFPGADGPPVPGGMEFLLTVSFDSMGNAADMRLLAAESYNRGLNRYRSENMNEQPFLPVEMLVNRAYIDENGVFHKPLYTDLGALPLIERQGEGTLGFQIPWSLLNVSDPSSGMVLYDDNINFSYPPGDALQTIRSDSILITGLFSGQSGTDRILFPHDGNSYTDQIRYEWSGWNVPEYRERKKKSFAALTDFFKGERRP